MPGKIPWDMLSTEEQDLYQRLCRAMSKGVVCAEQALRGASACPSDQVHTLSNAELGAMPPPDLAALQVKCEAARQAHRQLVSRYREH